MFDEKYIDLTEYGADHDLRRYLANGWRIKHEGATLVILEKERKTYSIIAGEFIKAISDLASKQKNLENFETYLTYHFPEWLEKYANTPGAITAELKAFADMEI